MSQISSASLGRGHPSTENATVAFFPKNSGFTRAANAQSPCIARVNTPNSSVAAVAI
jgi:hypothetical protein